MSAPPRTATGHPLWFGELPDVLQEAVDAYDLPNSADWGPLEELSSQTVFEDIEVYGSAAVVEAKDEFVAPATVHVELIYDPNSNEPVSFNDSYPARVHFRVANKDKKEVEVKKIDVDTSSFYE